MSLSARQNTHIMSIVLHACLTLLLSFFICKLLLKKTPPLPPGPWGFPIIGSIPFIGRSAHSGLANLAHRYGPIMYLKMGTCNVLVASTSWSASIFLKTLDSQFANRPTFIAAHEITYGCQNMVLHPNRQKWSLLRRLSTEHLLGTRALGRWEQARCKEVELLVRTLYRFGKKKKAVKLSELVMCTLANILGLATMSQRVFGDLEGGESIEFKEMIYEILAVSGSNIGDFVPAVGWMDLQGVGRKMKGIHKRYDHMISRMIDEHQAKAGERIGNPDFLDCVMSCKEDGEEEEQKLTDGNVRGLIFDMFTAGTDTAAIVIEWAMAELINNPSILQRAQTEMDQVIGTSRRLQESDIINLPYLQAICKEALRLHPSTPLSIPHFSFDECTNVEGYYIPKNTTLLVNIWAIGRDPHVWNNPLQFDPDRFLDIGDQRSRFDYIPFGAGRRACVGKQAGIVFVQYIVGTLVQLFDWKLPDGKIHLNMDEMPGLALPMANPVVALVCPRLESSVYAI